MMGVAAGEADRRDHPPAGAPEKLAATPHRWSELTSYARQGLRVTSAQELASHRDALTADLIVMPCWARIQAR